MRALRLGLVGCGVLLIPAIIWAQAPSSATFNVAASTIVDGRPVAIAVADINGDHHLDVITADSDTNLISVMTGDGSGVLNYVDRYDAGTVPMGLAVADFDGDTIPDVLVSNANMGSVTLLKGDGDLTFPSFTQLGDPIVLPGACSGDPATACDPDVLNQQGMDQCEVAGLGTCHPVEGPGAMAVGDLNDDGRPDVAIVNEGSAEGDGELSILLSHGDGTFDKPAPVLAGSMSTAVVIADFNGDHHDDVAVANAGSDNVAVFLGDGAGHLSARIDSDVGVPATGVAAGDVNEDGHEDLIVSTANGITVMLGDGHGNFTTDDSFVAGNNPSDVAVADLNDDGHLDVAVSNSRSADASVLLGDGTGSFAPARTFVADGEPLSVAVGDLNEDGMPDVVTGDFLGEGLGSAVVFLNQGNGELQGTEDLGVGSNVLTVATGDIDNDGLPDLAVALSSAGGGALRIYLSRVLGGFVPTSDVALGQGTSALVLADFNRDGNLDVAATNNDSSNISILLGHGDGTFSSAPAVPTSAKPVACAVGDFNRDRIPDLAVVSIGDPGTVSIFLGTGDGAFQTGNTFATQNAPVSVAVGLFNNDAFEDLVIANNSSNSLTVLFGTGTGSFTAGPTVQQPGTGGPVAVVAVDADRDGKEDLAAAEAMAQAVYVFLGNGAGAFTLTSSAGAGNTPQALVVRDLNGDGRPDLAVANQVSNNVSLAYGQTTGRFQRIGASITVSRQPVAIVGADFDGDGRYDVATANSANTAMNVSVLRNITNSPTLLRGDGNGDGRVNAADLVAAQRAAGAVDRGRPEDISNVVCGLDVVCGIGPGVDANGDGIITGQDTRATATRIFLPVAGA